MKLPSEPKTGYSVAAKISELTRWMRGERIISVVGGTINESPNGKTIIVDTKPARESGASQLIPLYLLTAKPSYLPEPESPPPAIGGFVWVEWGSINNTLADNWREPLEVTSDQAIYADISLNQYSNAQIISSWRIASDDAVPDQPEWPQPGPGQPVRPAKCYILLGYYHLETGTVTNAGGGSLLLAEHATDIGANYSTAGSYITKSISWARQNY